MPKLSAALVGERARIVEAMPDSHHPDQPARRTALGCEERAKALTTERADVEKRRTERNEGTQFRPYTAKDMMLSTEPFDEWIAKLRQAHRR
jgi:hypothetical protein